MEDDDGSNISNKTEESIDDSLSRSSSSTRNDEIGDNGASFLRHELTLEDSMDDFDTPKILCLNEDGEQWLHIRESPDPRIEEYLEKQAVATTTSMKSSQNFSDDDKKKEGRLSSLSKRDEEKTTQAKTAFEAILQTQELSPSQTTLTQIYTQMQTELQTQHQTQTQETTTQQSMPMSLLEYLNQPTQEDNEKSSINVGIGSSIEILSGKELSALNSGSSSLLSSSRYPPNASAFLCFEKVTLLGAEQKSYITVKDTRVPSSTSTTHRVLEEEIELLRANGCVSNEWKPFMRRALTILYPGDRIRIRTKASDALKSAVSIDPDISLPRNTLITLTYKYTKTPTRMKTNHSLAGHVAQKKRGETNINIDMNVNDETPKNGNHSIPKAKTSQSWDKGPNTFVGTTKREGEKMAPRAEDVTSPQSISSVVIGSSLSIGIDSTVNIQQESLRSSRMNLLNRNLDVPHEFEGEMVGNKNANSVNDSSLCNGDLADMVMKETQNKSAKSTDEKHRVNGASLNIKSSDCNHLGNDDNNTEKNPEKINRIIQNDQVDVKENDGDIQVDRVNVKEDDETRAKALTTAATQQHNKLKPDVANTKTHFDRVRGDDAFSGSIPCSVGSRDSAATLLLTQTQQPASIGSGESAATILMTQEVDFIVPNKSHIDRGNKKDGQGKMWSNHNAETETETEGKKFEDTPKHSVDYNANIPRNIEIADGDQEDGDRPPISQLLLSIETDNEYEDDRIDENVSPARQAFSASKANASSTPDKMVMPNSKSHASSTKINSQSKASSAENDVSIADQRTCQSDHDACIGVDRGESDNMKNAIDLKQARNTMADGVTEESDDETVLGAVVMMHNTSNSSTLRQNGMEIPESANDNKEAGNYYNSFEQDCLSREKISSFVDDENDIDRERHRLEDAGPTEVTTKITKLTIEEWTGPRTRKSKLISITNNGQPKGEAMQMRAKRKSASVGGRSTAPPESSTCFNTNAENCTSTGSLGPNKRRRTRYSTRETCLKNSISAVSRAADELYKKRFHAAIESSVIHIAVSGFEETELARISKLCKTKFSNVKKLKIIDTIDDKITACILPTIANDIDEASCRTLKAIQCAILGIPIVMVAWLEQCEEEGSIIIPTRYIRTLSSNVGKSTMREQARYGVARLAAARCREPQNLNLPFQNAAVFLCGKYSIDKRKNITKLLKEGSATVVTSSREALVQLESAKEESSDNVFVLLVGDGGISLPKSLENEVATALETVKSRRIYVVDCNWVSLSIVCAGMLPPDSFKPTSNSCEYLWRLSMDLPEK